MFELRWFGKENAIKEAFTIPEYKLIEDKGSSKNWDSTENLYIEGDNLEVLKLLQQNYYNKVKMIYIDPPYNTGKDFVYKDNFNNSIKNYKEITNQNFKSNIEVNGRFHTNWLNMMYPRLSLARNLLTDDGIIFISIDDNEVDNLRKICDEIFGENNFINNVVVKMSEVSGNKMAHVEKKLPKIKEYVLVYKKKDIKLNKIKLKKEEWDKEYNIFLENFSERDKKTIDEISNSEERTEEHLKLIDDILSRVETKSVSNKLQELNILKSDELKWKLDNAYRICRTATSTSVKKLADEKRKVNKNRFFSVLSNKENIVYIVKSDYLEDSNSPRVQVLFAEDNLSIGLGDLWIDITTTGLEFEGDVDYKNGKKPLKLIDRLIELSTNEGDLVVDFFSGASTTAESILRNNLKDNNYRKFIMVQFPENLNKTLEESTGDTKKSIKKSIDFLDSINKPRILSEIGKERIRRAGKKIVEENKDKEGIDNLDIGFKVFKLEEDNMRSLMDMYKVNQDDIIIEIIKRPKQKPTHKFKIDESTYYLYDNEDEINIFCYKQYKVSKVTNEIVIQRFKKTLKDKHYLAISGLYNDKLNEFNGKEFLHSQYITSAILDEVYKYL